MPAGEGDTGSDRTACVFLLVHVEGVGPGQGGTPINDRSVWTFVEGQPDRFEMGEVLSDGTFVVMVRYTTAREGDAIRTWDPPPPDGAADATDADTTPPGTAPLVACHCLTYPNLTGGRLVTIKDCFPMARECAAARAERWRGHGADDPPIPACEAESRPSCGQAVFEK
ncbi:MAG: hypothetical protein HY905_19000 [Deltaproteobacteria bacterium]|nr:hypothetical protein [Deltaproteobacteria bacterium]